MFKSTLITTATIFALSTASFADRNTDDFGNGSSPLQDANSQTPQPQAGCAGDTNDDLYTDVNDLSKVFTNWGLSCSQGCLQEGDLNGDGTIDVMDLILIVTNWGACEVEDEPAAPKPDAFADDFGDGSSDTPGDAPDDAAPYPWTDFTGDGINPHDPDADPDADTGGDTIGDAGSDNSSPWDDYFGNDTNPNRPSDNNPIPSNDLPQDAPQDGELDYGNANGR